MIPYQSDGEKLIEISFVCLSINRTSFKFLESCFVNNQTYSKYFKVMK